MYLQHSCVCLCYERYSHRAIGSVRKGLDILPHSFLLSSKLRYVLSWYCMSRDGPAFGQITIHTYIHYKTKVYPNFLCQSIDLFGFTLIFLIYCRQFISISHSYTGAIHKSRYACAYSPRTFFVAADH